MLIRHSQNIFFILIFSLPLLSQDTINSLDFFPHHVGDIWEYYDPNWPNGPLDQNKILSDSLGADGKYYIATSKDGYFILDTTNMQVFHSNKDFSFAESFQLRYKLDADSGDWWISYQDSFGRMSVTVSDVFFSFIWDSTPILTKRMDYYGSGNTGDSLLYNTDFLSLGFGLISQNFDTFPFRRLKGTFINGELHGTVTIVQREEEVPLGDFTLYQNYPNPFNPSTMFRFELPEDEHITLKVFDMLGKEVATVVNGFRQKGYYEEQFDASSLPSGMYVYRLTAGSHSSSMKMMLMK